MVNPNVKGAPPEALECPFCAQNGMVIWQDPVCEGRGRWLHCSACGWAGDLIEFYAKWRGLELRDAIRELSAKKMCALTDGDLTEEAVASYLQQYPLRRHGLDACWQKMLENTNENLNMALVARLRGEKLNSGWTSGAVRSLRRHVGGGTRAEIHAYFKTHPLPETGFSTVLAVRLQDVPGRICGFQYLGDGITKFQLFSDPGHQTQEGGLLMLDQLQPFVGTVYAFDDPNLVLQLYRKSWGEAGQPINVVGYNDATERAWYSVRAERVVLWSRRNDWQVFKHARRLGTALVSDETRLRDCLAHEAVNPNLRKIFHRLDQEAKSWPEALALWLTDERRDELSAQDALRGLDLNARERARVMDDCPNERRMRLADRFGVSNDIQRVSVFGHSVVQREGCWWISGRRTDDELITDAPFRIDEVSYDRLTKRTKWAGIIRYQGAAVPFLDDSKLIEKNPAEWLKNKVLADGRGLPVVLAAWSGRLPNVAQLFHQPKQIQTARILGYDMLAGRFVFPNFVIEEGEFREGRTIASTTPLPGDKLFPPRVEETFDPPVVSGSQAVAAALFAAVVANWLAPLRGVPRLPLAIIGGDGSLGQTVARKLTEILGFQRLEIRGYEDVKEGLNEYGYPALLEARGLGCWANCPGSTDDPVLALLGPLEAAALAVGGSWNFLQAEEFGAETVPLPAAGNWLRYLADLQRRRFDLPQEGTLLEAVLRDYCLWRLGGQTQLFSAAWVRLRLKKPADQALADLCAKLCLTGKLVRKHVSFFAQTQAGGPFPNSRADILVDDVFHKIFISRTGLLKALQREKLPSPDLAEAVRLLAVNELLDAEASSEGWVVPQAFLEDAVRGR